MRVASPSVLPRPNATASQRGGRSSSPATPHTKRRWRRERRSTFPPGAAGEGEGRAEPRRLSPRSALLPRTPEGWRPTGRAQLGPSVPRPLPRLPVVVGEGYGRPVATMAGGWGWLLSLPLWEWAPPWVRSKPFPLQWRAGCSPTPRIVLVWGGTRKICQGSPPLLRGLQDGGALLGLLARVGDHHVPPRL